MSTARVSRLVAVAALLVSLAPRVRGQTLASFDSVPSDRLLRRSWDTPSTSEKVTIRYYLATRRDTTVEGQFSRAWLLGWDGHADASQRAYRALLERDPRNLYALHNLGADLPAQERVALSERALAVDPAFFDYAEIRQLYFTYLDGLKDTARADGVLREWEGKLGPVWVFDYIRGLRAERRAQYDSAATLYEAAIGRGKASFDAYRALVDVRLDHLSSVKTPGRDTLMQPALDYAEHAEDASEALLYVANRLRDTFRAPMDASPYYLMAFRTHPSAEAITALYDATWWMHDDALERIIAAADSVLPENALLLRDRGRAALDFRGDTTGARRYYERAIAAAHTLSDTAQAVYDLADKLLQDARFDFAAAEALERDLLRRGADRPTVIVNLYWNSVYAGRFDAARKYLADYDAALKERGSSLRDTWRRDQEDMLARYTAMDSARDRFAAENPFLGYWQELFGPKLRVSIGFPAGSATVSATADEALARIAKSLKEPGADRYVFAVEGFADESEPGAEALARQRAKAVATALFDRYGVALSLMQVDGRGTSIPASPLRTPAGIAANRRVEIMPVGSISSPSVAVTSTLRAAGSIATSPDGRLVALGIEPVQLWDLALGVPVRTLGTGLPVRFSPDGRLLAATSSYTEAGGQVTHSLFVYDTKTGVTVARMASKHEIGGFDWSPAGDEIAFTNDAGQLVIFSVTRGRPVRVTGARTSPIVGKVAWLRDGASIATGMAQDSVVRIWRASDLALLRTLGGVSWPHSLLTTADRRYLVCLDNEQTLTAWDLRTWTRRQMRVPVISNSARPHPSLPLIVAASFSAAGSGYADAVIDVATMRVRAVAWHPRFAASDFSADGKSVLEVVGDTLVIADAMTMRRTGAVTGTADIARGAAADQAHGLFVSSDAGGVHVWNVASGKRVHSWADAGRLLGAVAGDSSTFLTTTTVAGADGDSVSELALRRTTDFSTTPLARTDLEVTAWTSAPGFVAVAGPTWADTTADTGYVEIYRTSGERVARIPVQIHTEYLKYDRIFRSGFSGLALGPGARSVAVATFWHDGFGHPTTYSKRLRYYDVATGALRHDVEFGDPIEWVRPDSAGRVAVSTLYYTFVYDTAGHYTGEQRGTGAAEVELRGGGVEVLWSGTGFRVRRGGRAEQSFLAPSQLVGAAIFPAQRLFVTLDASNQIAFYDLERFTRRLSIVAKRDDEWIAFAPSGEFVASMLGTEKAFWSLGDRMLPFEALKAKYERPDVIAQQLSAVASGAAADTTAAPAIAAEAFADPYTFAVAKAVTETPARSYTLEVTITKRHPSLPDPELVFRQQGIALPPDRAPAEIVRAADGTLRVSRTFDLSEGTNVLDVDYRAGAAVRRGATVRVDSRAAAGEAPRLWFLGIGTSHYADSAQNLDFADRDVREAARAFKAQEGKLFSAVNTLLLVDSAATGRAIAMQLREFLGRASSRDVVVIYLAGHGVEDANQTLYYMPYDGVLAKPYTGYKLDDVQEVLRTRPPTQKALVFIDICHAGAYGTTGRGFGDELTADDAAKLLANGTGLVVLASSSPREPSLESLRYEGGHGAFTAAVLEAFQGHAPHTSDYLTVGQLEIFVEQRVPELSHGLQHPVTALIEGLRDFPIARIPATTAGRGKD